MADQCESPEPARKRSGSKSGMSALEQLADECFRTTSKKSQSSATAIAAPIVALETNQQSIKFAGGVLTVLKKPTADENKSLSYEAQIEYDNGDLYRGTVQGGKMQGHGRMVYKSGDIYEGDFLNNKKSGRGFYSFSKGGIYTGEFAEGTFNGNGTKINTDGTRYEGSFVNGKLHGFGTIIRANGEKYVGEVEDDQAHGQGTGTYSAFVYDGQFEKGVPDGEGSLLFKNGVHYIGQIKDGTCHGKGTLYMPNGWVYKGNFVEDKLEGDVICQYKNQRYVQEYRNGKAISN